jgi:hypothetical protein
MSDGSIASIQPEDGREGDPRNWQALYIQDHHLLRLKGFIDSNYPGGEIIQPAKLINTVLEGWCMLVASRISYMKYFYGVGRGEDDEEIFFGFVESDIPNANAISFGTGNYFVLLTTKMLSMVCAFCSNIACTAPIANFLSFDEIDGRIGFPSNNSFSTSEILNRPISNIACNDEAPVLVASTISVVICHELTHIFHGHLDFALTTGSISERHLPAERDSRLTRQTLELDADAGAIRNAAASFSEGPNPASYARYISSPDASLKLVAVGAWCLFKISELIYSASDNWQEEYTHPPAYVRSFFSGGAVAQTRTLIGGDLFESIEEIAGPAFLYGEQSFIALTGDSVAAREFENRLPEIHNFMKLFRARWAKIRPDLMRSKVGNRGLSDAQSEPA